MKTKHVFVSVLDVAEIVPFCIKDPKEIDGPMVELAKFIDALQKNYGKGIYHLGLDIIGERYLQRFLFEGEGFLEIMVEAPAAILAHFVHKAEANSFVEALKKTLKIILPKGTASELMINNIEVQKEEEALTHEKWKKIKDIRSDS